jgi:WD40 repeat protein
MLVHTNTI